MTAAMLCEASATPADELSLPEVRACAVRLLPADRRTRVALAHVVVGPVVLVLSVARLRKGLEVRPPVAEDGASAIGVSPELWAQIEAAALAAVQADPAARAHLSRRAG
jgi:hypothetical protein